MRLPQLTKQKIIKVLFIFFIIFIVLFILPKNFHNSQIAPVVIPTQIPYSLAKVTRVIDGDTIDIDTGQRVRYIGINSPEMYSLSKPIECYAQEAKDRNTQLVEGKTVKLTKDISETDKYGRLLRYVFLYDQSSSEAKFINKLLITEGYAKTMPIRPDIIYAQLLYQEEQNAKKNKTGLWSKCY